MQIVIEIDEKDKQEIDRRLKGKGLGFLENAQLIKRIVLAVFHGTPLPKGHGDLIDKSKIYKANPAEEDNCTGMCMSLDEMDAYNEGIDAMYLFVEGAPTIIEADRSGKIND